jgi:hypothetical protein
MSAVLLDYEDIDKPQLETGSGFANRPGSFPHEFPLFEMPVGREMLKLRRPLVLRLSIEEGEYFVENETLSLFGNGRTLSEAVSEFFSGLASTWEYYRSLTADQVVGRGRELKQILDNLTE